MNEIIKVEVAILGAGVAGIHCGSALNYFNISNCIIEKNEYIGGQPIQLYPNKPIYDFPAASSILSQDVVINLYKQLMNYKKTQIYLSTIIIDIKYEDNHFLINTNLGKSIFCKYIVIATGIGAFLPNKLEINNKTYHNSKIEYTVDIEPLKYKNKKIVILGGGDSAVDWANYFIENKITNNVSIVHRRDEYRAKSISVNNLRKNLVKEYKNFQIIDCDKQLITIQHNLANEIIKLEYDFLIVQYGQKINYDKIPLLNKIIKGHKNLIVTDQNQKTNVKNIFAIGGCTYFLHKPNTILNACADGMTVAWYLSKQKEDIW